MNIDNFASLPAILWQNGYRPVPINRGAKFPLQKEWQIKARETPPWLVTHGVSEQQPGIGLLGDGLRIIDADIDDPERAAAFDDFMQQYHPGAPLRFRAGSPRHVRIFRADEGEPPKSYVVNKATKERVEILGFGNQCFCFGIHPESGQSLQWINGPHEVKRDALPVLSQVDVERILEFGGDLIAADRSTVRKPATEHVARVDRTAMPQRQPGGEWPISDLRSALAAIPNQGADYDWWFEITCAVFDACGGSTEGYAAWLDWCAQCDDATLAECDKLWDALMDSPMYFGAGTLVHHARLHDPLWDRPSFRRDDGPSWPPWDEDPPDETEPGPESPAAAESFTMVRLRDLSLTVEPREFIYGHSLIRGMLSMLGGTGGVGKTSYKLVVLISIILGRPLLATEEDERQHRIFEPGGTVAYYSLEDPMDDLIRRVNAIIKQFNLNPRQIWDKLFLQSGRDQPLVVASCDRRGRLIRSNIDPIVEFLREKKVDVFSVDPFANSFEGADGTESGSDGMKLVCDQYRQIVHRANCAGWLAHHFRKGGMAGDADAFRGSSMLQNAARCMETLTTMTQDAAELLGVPETERRNYIRLENAKVNLTAAPAEGQWFRICGVPLGNRTEKYPDGDIIGVPVRWIPQAVEVPWSQIETALNSIAAGCDNGTEFYSSKPNSSRRASDVIVACTGLKQVQAKALLDEWLRLGVLQKDSYRSKQSRNSVERLVVDQDAKKRLQGGAK